MLYQVYKIVSRRQLIIFEEIQKILQMLFNRKLYSFFAVILIAFGSFKAQQSSGFAEARFGFLHPQDSTRTKVWWFHGETETTKECITADLTAFKKAVSVS
jgi:hypothetical protein